MALLIRSDGTREEFGDGKPISLDTMHKLVGNPVQMVACDPKVTGSYDHYICAEEGKMHGLPLNPAATDMSTYTMRDDFIVGDVIFCKTKGVESV